MASIVVKLEPKKTNFIVDYRSENKTSMKKLMTRTIDNKLFSKTTKSKKTSSDSGSFVYDITSCAKQGSFYSNSTATTKKIKSK